MSDDTTPVLAVHHLSYEYGALLALDDVSLDVHAGEFVALIGRNGAGKSTLLRCVAGWTRPSDGEIAVLGLSTQEHERELRRRVVLVPDTPPFYDDLTAWEHLQFVAQAQGVPGWETRAEALLRSFGLWSSRKSFPLAYSRGMRYKLGLCLALLVAPSLLLLDEPFGPLDPVSADHLLQELGEQQRSGIAVLLSCHQLPPQARPDRYIVMEEGQIIAQGSGAEIAGDEAETTHYTLDDLLVAALERFDQDA